MNLAAGEIQANEEMVINQEENINEKGDILKGIEII